MSFKNVFLRFLARSISASCPSLPIPRRILAVSTTALGDTLWTMSALASLRDSFPDAYISLLTSKIGLEITKHNPWTDAVYLFQCPFHLWHHLRGQFDTILLFHASQRILPAFCASLGATRFIGTSRLNKGLDDLFTSTLPLVHQHEIDRRLALIKHIGGRAKPFPLSFFLKPEEKIPLQEQGRWIALHPGAKDSYKCWPLEHFASLARLLQKNFPHKILITGGASELPLMQRLAALIPDASLSDHTFSLRQFAAKLDAVDLLISSDTGPFHLASSLKTPAIAIYSPTDPSLCGPYLCPTSFICSKPPTCRPCLKRKCREPFCLLQISPEEVLDKAKILLNANRPLA